MMNFQDNAPRPLFNERRSRVYVVKDEIPDITYLSSNVNPLECSIDLTAHDRSNNFLMPQTPPNKIFGASKKSIVIASGSQCLIPGIGGKRKSLTGSDTNSVTFVYDGIEDKVKNIFLKIFIS